MAVIGAGDQNSGDWELVGGVYGSGAADVADSVTVPLPPIHGQLLMTTADNDRNSLCL